MDATERKVVLPSGNHAVYYTHHTDPESIRMYGTQVAVRFGDDWIRSGRAAHAVDRVTSQRWEDLPVTEYRTNAERTTP